MSDAEGLTEADDTLDDDCTCSPECTHESVLMNGQWRKECDPSCPVHGESV